MKDFMSTKNEYDLVGKAGGWERRGGAGSEEYRGGKLTSGLVIHEPNWEDGASISFPNAGSR